MSVAFNEETTITLLLMDGTAQVGSDYSGSSHQVVFSPGQSQACVSIPVIDDDECEVTESFSVKLPDPAIVGSYILGQPKTCTVSIMDNDSMYAGTTMYGPQKNSLYNIIITTGYAIIL